MIVPKAYVSLEAQSCFLERSSGPLNRWSVRPGFMVVMLTRNWVISLLLPALYTFYPAMCEMDNCLIY